MLKPSYVRVYLLRCSIRVACEVDFWNPILPEVAGGGRNVGKNSIPYHVHDRGPCIELLQKIGLPRSINATALPDSEAGKIAAQRRRLFRTKRPRRQPSELNKNSIYRRGRRYQLIVGSRWNQSAGRTRRAQDKARHGRAEYVGI